MRFKVFAALSVTATVTAVIAFVSAVSADPSDHGRIDYVALGDSHAAGTGAGGYRLESGNCLRSQEAYAEQIAIDNRASFTSAACSGATTADIASQAAALNDGTDLVTVQIGGNDAGFSTLLGACISGTDADCDVALTSATAFMHGQLGAQLDGAYDLIRSKAANAHVVVVGYPRLFELGACPAEMSEHKRSRLNAAADTLAAITVNRATAAGFTFADTRDAFAGRGVCGGESFIHGLRNPFFESYHPTADGHRAAYYPAVRAVL